MFPLGKSRTIFCEGYNMKHLFATAAVSALVLGLSAPAMAQSNTSTVNQVGISQDAQIDQLGGAANNYSTVLQGLNGPGSDGNKADIDQDGTVNLENYSTLIQDGTRNEGIINQNGNGSGDDYNYSHASQTGVENKVDVLQGDLATNNTSVIDQDGSINESTVRQGGGEGGNLVNYSAIDQDGFDNTAIVEQGGANSVANTSYITQNSVGLSAGNTATVKQH